MSATETLDTIGKRLRYARTKRGLGSRELARLAGLKSESHPSLIEGGRENIALDVILRLARALDVSMDWLAGGDGEAPELEPFPPRNEDDPDADESPESGPIPSAIEETSTDPGAR